MSETFVTDGISGSASYPKSGATGSNTAAAATIGFVYDAASGTYTVSAAGRSQAFTAADRNAALSSAGADVYVRVNGTTTDSLTLTRGGTGGRFNYTYVGSGFWQRTVDGTSTISGSIDGFTFGIRTPAGAVPTSGTGNFTTDLLGVIAYSTNLNPMQGEGVLKADFASGGISLIGFYQVLDTATGLYGPASLYQGSAAMTSGSNAFTGTINIFPFNNTLSGQFYGPAADELGAKFFGTDGTNSVMGTLLGRRAGSGTGGDGLLSRTGDQQFAQFNGLNVYPNLQAPARTYQRNAAGAVTVAPGPGSNFDQLIINYTDGTYRFLQSNTPLTTFTAADRVAAETTDISETYRTSSGFTNQSLQIYRPGGSNPLIALTYTGFGNWITSSPGTAVGDTQVSDRWFVFGELTNPLILPETGTATYAGQLRGSGQANTVGGGLYALNGAFNLVANFGAGTVGGSMLPILIALNGGSAPSLSSLTMAGNINRGASVFNGTLNGSGISSGNSFFAGNFMGPAADEVALGFLFSVNDPANPGQFISVYGVGAGDQR